MQKQHIKRAKYMRKSVRNHTKSVQEIRIKHVKSCEKRIENSIEDM